MMLLMLSIKYTMHYMINSNVKGLKYNKADSQESALYFLVLPWISVSLTKLFFAILRVETLVPMDSCLVLKLSFIVPMVSCLVLKLSALVLIVSCLIPKLSCLVPRFSALVPIVSALVPRLSAAGNPCYC
jgi:hypothetical protein